MYCAEDAGVPQLYMLTKRLVSLFYVPFPGVPGFGVVCWFF